jgi:hypothetical protein
MAAVSELCGRLGVMGAIDAAVGPVKQRDRGLGAGELLAGIAAGALAGEDFLTGLDRQRDDTAGQLLAPVPGLASTTAAELARRITPAQCLKVETGLAAVTERMLAPERVAGLAGGPVTTGLDATDVEGCGRKKRGVAYNHQGQRAGRPHVAIWAQTETVLAADLGWGTDDVRAAAPACCAGRWPACPRPRGGPGGWRCARTPGMSPGRWPARPATSTSPSRSARSGSRRCGGCWPASPSRTSTMPLTCTPRRSRWRSTARTGGRPPPGC